jgi:Fanconi anemia group M protein
MKCIFLTPTKPLVLKRIAILQEKLTIPEHIKLIIGTIPNEKRAKLFQDAKVVVMTPNVLYNDIIHDMYDLRNVSLIVFDECHRATGKHAYVMVANHYFLQKSNGKILGITTSLVIILITKGTADERYYWVVKEAEKKLKMI